MTPETATHTPGSQCVPPGCNAPQTWDGFRESCHATFNGGHDAGSNRKAFHHGMDTVFNLLEAEFPDPSTCKAAPTTLAQRDRLVTALRDLLNNNIVGVESAKAQQAAGDLLRELGERTAAAKGAASC